MTTMYSIHIELDKRDPSSDYLEQLLEHAQHLHAAVGTSPRGWLDMQFSLPAEDLQQASLVALATAQQLAGVAAISIEVMTEAEFNARQGFTELPDLVSVSEAADLLRVSRQRVQQLIDEHWLTTARKVGATTVIARTDITGKMRAAVYSTSGGRTGVGTFGELVFDEQGRPVSEISNPRSQSGPVLEGTYKYHGIDYANGVVQYRSA